MAASGNIPHQPQDGKEDHVSFSSPKRKRDTGDEQGPRKSPMKLRTELPSRPVVGPSEAPTDAVSPRTRVSDQLRTMKLDVDFSVPVLNFGRSREVSQSSQKHSHDGFEASKTIPQTITQRQEQSRGASSTKSELSSLPNVSLELPITPTIEPTTSPQDAPDLISPLPVVSGAPDSVPKSPPNHPNPTDKSVRAPRMKSPPPTERSSAPSDLVWTADEITGHEATDPADDGYGINGIGFRPTPAIAQARAQKRRQQVADWRSREAKEARQRRFERRRGLDLPADADVRNAAHASRKVRFVEEG